MKKIQLGGHKKNGKIWGYTLVDDEDFEYLNQWKWHVSKSRNTLWYVVRSENPGTILMHRVIMKPPKGFMIDHINHDIYDNRKKNLRICTSQQNQFNRRPQIGTSKYRGVVWNKSKQKWQASIKKFKKLIYIGLFLDEREAALAWDKKAKELYGEYANLNFN